jgi:phage terminase large subunit GpA-like protein
MGDNTNEQRLYNTLISRLQLKDRIPVSDFAEQHLYLSPEYSKVAGLIRFDQHSYLREIVDRCSVDDPARIVVFRAGIQSGKTVVLQSFITSVIGQNPGPMLFVTDLDSKAELFSRKRLEYMIRDSPLLHSLVGDQRARDGSNTIKHKVFPGGDWLAAGAQSVTGLTSNTCRFLACDETDDYAMNVSSAGSAADLAMGRTTTYGDMAKILLVSSPKVRGQSVIDTWHDRGDQRVFEIPCPKCGAFQTLRFRDKDTGEFRLIWDKGDPSSARYCCAHCKKEFVNTDKNVFLPEGRWVATQPQGGDNGVITSYSLNALYLPAGSYSWSDAVRQWESAMDRLKAGDIEEHRTFVNTRLAESYDPPAETIDPNSLAAHESDYEAALANLDTLPARITPLVVGLTDPTVIREIIRKELASALRGISAEQPPVIDLYLSQEYSKESEYPQ